MVSYKPERGDLIWIDFDPQAGHEKGGRRPAIVLSGGIYNRRTGLAIVCPITSRAKGYPFEVALPDGLPISGVVLADQVKNIDCIARRSELISTAPESVLSEVHRKLDSLFIS